MRVAINHETIYRYQSAANYSVQYLRLTPISGATQRVLSWKLTGPGNLRPWTDAFGNAAHVLVIDKPHEEIRISAVGEVEIADGGKPLLSDGEPHSPELFLRSTRLTECDDRVGRFAQGFKPAFLSSSRKGLDRLMQGVRDAVDYKPGTTHSATSAREALDRKSGVCQDHAHLFVTCARSLGVPARYVSGYLCTDTAGDEQMASHAWAEAWVEGAGWLSYDIANRMSNARAHVRVAVGLDYLDAAPVRGIRRGGHGEELEVEVSVNDARKVKPMQAVQPQKQQQQ
ncbi:MAG TPA: transglutaminase family protein [Patescibacteria group bacterium]|nr:transglutaminase family protein [Patescibacteria group bacterium]